MGDSRDHTCEPTHPNFMTRRPRTSNERRREAIIKRMKYHIPQQYWLPAKEYLLLKGIDLNYTHNITQKLSLADKSKDSYESHFRAMRYFCCLIGDPL